MPAVAAPMLLTLTTGIHGQRSGGEAPCQPIQSAFLGFEDGFEDGRSCTAKPQNRGNRRKTNRRSRPYNTFRAAAREYDGGTRLLLPITTTTRRQHVDLQPLSAISIGLHLFDGLRCPRLHSGTEQHTSGLSSPNGKDQE